MSALSALTLQMPSTFLTKENQFCNITRLRVCNLTALIQSITFFPRLTVMILELMALLTSQHKHTHTHTIEQ